MKRSAALIPLSHDHHHALDAARRLQGADAATAGDAIAWFLAFWERDGARHFEIEERLILPALPDSDEAWSAATARIRAEHAEIRARAGSLGGPAGDERAQAARELGALLRDHVRFEERELFVMLEARLSPEALARLGDAVAAAERRA